MSDRAAILAANVAALGMDGLGSGPHEGWRVDWSGAWPSIFIETEAGSVVTLHSRRAPVEEARAQLVEARGSAPWPPLVVLLGGGLGYAVDVIEADAPRETRIVVIEPFASAAAAMLSRRDWRPLVDVGRLTMVVGPTFGGAGELWRQIEPRGASPLVVEQPVVARVRPDAIAAARKVFDRASFDAAANNEARETLGGRYLVNTLFNLRRIVAGRDLRALQGVGRGRTAVVCGAGPSLNRNLDSIRDRRADVVLVAVDTALRPTLESGLSPDFVVALDPAPLNARHLSGLRLSDETLLVSEAALDPSAFDSFGGNVAFFRVGGNDPWPWLLEQGVDVPILAAWGSVLTSAFAFAEMLDCDPIVLAGADLAWTGGQPYCRGTAFELDWGRVVVQGPALPDYWRRLAARKATEHPPDLHGQPVDTAPHLVAFRDWLVNRAARSGRRVVNLTGAGLLHGPAISQSEDIPVTKGSDPFVTRLLKHNEFKVPGLSELRDDEPPLSDWIATYSRSLDRAMLDMALSTAPSLRPTVGPNVDPNVGPNFSSGVPAGGNAGTEGPASVPSPSQVPPRALVALPEALAILRAARDGAALPEWATTSTAWDLVRARTDTATALAALLRLPRLGTTVAAGDRVPSASGHLHLLYGLEWPQPVLEAVSAMLIDAASRLRESPPGRHMQQRFRSAHASETAEAPARHAERRAQAFVASIHAARLAAAADADSARTVLALVDAASAAIEQSPASSDARVRITVSADGAPACWRTAAPLSAATLAEALRGAVLGAPTTRPRVTLRDAGTSVDVAWDVRTIDRDVLHREYLGTAPYGVLTDEGLPRCLIATPAPDGTAIATPRGQTASYRVREDGSFERMAQWPAPIVGEVHGSRGQAAWTFTTPARLLFRARDEAAPIEAEVAFQAYTAVWWQNAVVLTTSDGLWTWRPGESPAKATDLPPAVIAHLDADKVELDPLPLAAGRLTRTRLPGGWTIDLATRVVRERPLGAAGQRWMVHRKGDTSATGLPQADVVRIEHRGDERMLVWPSPRTATWAGKSLVVNTTSGEVVIFPDLAHALSRFGS